jgi:HD-GYP domain-containing protein (c-di-GMP phosphodiesterase class II)
MPEFETTESREHLDLPKPANLNLVSLNLASATDETTSAIGRTAYVLGDGISEGFINRAHEAWQSPMETSSTIAASFGIGLGLKFLQKKAGVLQLGGQIIAAGMAYGYGRDMYGRVENTYKAIADTWSSANNIESNKAVIAQSLGSFAFDFTLGSVNSGLGAGVLGLSNRFIGNGIKSVDNGNYLSRLKHISNDHYLLPNMRSFDHASSRYLRGLCASLRAYDPDTFAHSARVTELSLLLGKRIGLSSHEIGQLSVAGPLHDVGKIMVPKHILNKPDILTPGELKALREHAEASYALLSAIKWPNNFRAVPDIAASHHEHLDGTGYFRQLQGHQLSKPARVLCVADQLDAIASPRSYKTAKPLDEVLAILKDKADKGKLDSEIVQAVFDLPVSKVLPVMQAGGFVLHNPNLLGNYRNMSLGQLAQVLQKAGSDIKRSIN